MGTRHLICIYHNGRFVLAQYGQWDGYPDGQGADVLAFLKISGNIALLAAKVENLQPLSSTEVNEYIKAWIRENPDAQPRGTTQPCPPSLNRDTGAKMLDIIVATTPEQRVPVFLELDFVRDDVYCEWAYVIDLDGQALEVYCARNSMLYGSESDEVNGEGRLDQVEGSVVTLVGKFAFDELPEQDLFVRTCRVGVDPPDGEDSSEEDEARAGSGGAADE